ncbi:TorD/DmsD family molecular chaperone [Humidesulfovibrio idahonensis]
MNENPAESIRLAQALRDFFAAADAAGLARAYAGIAAGGAAPPEPVSWLETEYAFNRLFVGPGALVAPPYSSVYLDPEPRLLGRATEMVRAVHEILGLEATVRGCGAPDDHLSVEIDTALALRARQEAAPNDENLRALRRYFVAEHMDAWIPVFADRVLRSPATPAVIGFAVRKLEKWLRAEKAVLPPYGDDTQPATEGECS